MPVDYVFRPLFNFHIGGCTYIFNSKTLLIKKSKVGCGNTATINKLGIAKYANKSSPGGFTNQGSKLCLPE